MSFSANRNPLLRDFFHCNLLIISFIGGVQWNKDLGPPAVMSHLIEGGARWRRGQRQETVRVVGSVKMCASWAASRCARRGQRQDVRVVGSVKMCASWAASRCARRGQRQDVRVVGSVKMCASWAASRCARRGQRQDVRVVGSVKTGRINAQPLGCPVHRKASSDTIVTGAFGHHKISRQLGGVKGAGELVKAMTKASRWAS